MNNEKEKKYEIVTDDSIESSMVAGSICRLSYIKNKDAILHRIRALKDFDNDKHISKGDLGGYIESEENLSQEGTCWVGGNAVVFGDSIVTDSASVWDDAVVVDGKILSNATVCGEAEIFGGTVNCDAIVSGNAFIDGDVSIEDYVHITEHAYIKADPALRIVGKGIISCSSLTGKGMLELREGEDKYDEEY